MRVLIALSMLVALGACTMGGPEGTGSLEEVERAAVFSKHAGKVCPGFTFDADAANADRASQDVSVDERIDAAEKARSALKLDIRNGAYSPAGKYCKTLDDPAVLADLKYLMKNT